MKETDQEQNSIKENPFATDAADANEVQLSLPKDNNFPEIDDEELDLKKITFSQGKSVKIENKTKINFVFPSTKNSKAPFNFNEKPIVELNELTSVRESRESFRKNSIDKSRLVGFDEDIDINNEFRKYNDTNVNNGKPFFRLRYIANQVYIHMMMLREGEKDDKEIIIEANNKYVLKYNSIFLQKLEKAILFFNIKKYDESYNTLKDANIIEDLSEFGEFLLTVKGFDKTLIGDFLSKEKHPNEKYVVTEHFCNKINHKSANILRIFRFLLTRINLPLDASALLIIIDKFSVSFFKENKEKFADSDSLYLLFSTILALNSMIYNKNPKVKVNPMKVADFIKMNEKVTF